MKHDFIKFANGEYAFTDESGKINLIKCDRSDDFVYILLCKEEELERLERENRMWMNAISRLRKNEKDRRKWNINYIILVPASIILFFVLKPISIIFGLLGSFMLLTSFKLFVNLVCGWKKDNKEKIDYAMKKYNENRDRIPVLMNEIERMKIESNYRVVNRDNNENRNKYSFNGYGINREDDDVKIVHITRILSK